MSPGRWLRESVREWGWRHAGWGVLIGSLSLFNMGQLLLMPSGFPLLGAWLYNVFQFGMPYVFALRLADRAVDDGAPRPLAYAAVVLLIVPLGVWVFGPLLSMVLGGADDWTPRHDVGLWATRLLPFGVGTLAYASWRQARDMRERVQAAEHARALQEQSLQSARLLVLQARVEPQFLFETLRRVRERIDRSAQSAEQLLADLITLLRALQPAAGATASTVQREFALVQAYGRASELSALQSPRLLLDAKPAVHPARLAPLVLLPVLRALAGNAPAAGWLVAATQAGPRLVIEITPHSPGALSVTALASLDLRSFAERLTAVHGPDATIAVRTATTAPALRIDLPLQLEETDHDPSPDR
jgi:hypothetical protein